MAKQTINIGTVANDRSGDPLRTAFTKVNANFTELYNRGSSSFSGSYNDLTNKPNIPDDIADLADSSSLLADIGDVVFTDNAISAQDGVDLLIHTHDNDDKERVSVNLIPNDGAFIATALSDMQDQPFLSNQWASAQWVTISELGYLVVTNSPAIISFINSAQFDYATSISFRINGGDPIVLGNYTINGNNITFNTLQRIPEESPIVVNEINFDMYFSSNIAIDYDQGEIRLNAVELDINISTTENIGISSKFVDVTGDGTFSIKNKSASDSIDVVTNSDASAETWSFGADGTLTFPDNTVQSTAWTGNLVDLEDLIPAEDSLFDLGSPERQWRSLYVSANTIFVGGTPISVSGGDLLVDGLPVVGGTTQPYIEFTNDALITIPTTLGQSVTVTAEPAGSGAAFTVVISEGSVLDSITATTAGTNYVVGQRYKIGYGQIGGNTESDSLIFTINTVNGSGGILTVANTEFVGVADNTTGSYTGQNADYIPSVFDAIDTGLTLTRDNQRALFNIEEEAQYDNNLHLSPLGTSWNSDGWGDLSNVRSRSYTTLRESLNGAIGENIIDAELVMHDTINDKFYKFNFSAWGQDNAGGFAYVRNLIDEPNYFAKTDYGNEIDIFVADDGDGAGIGITRDNNGGIYNPYRDEGWDDDVSPSGTLWNIDGWNDLSNIETRTYLPLDAAYGGALGNRVPGSQSIMYIPDTEEYYAIQWINWTQNNAGGGFSYIRKKIDLTKINEGIRFADGTVLKSAADVVGRVKSTASSRRRIEEVYGEKTVYLSQAVTTNLSTVPSREVTNGSRIFISTANTTIDDILDSPGTYDITDTNTMQFSVDNNNWYVWDGSVTYPNEGEASYGLRGFSSLTYGEGDTVYFRYKTGGAPVVWWDKTDLPAGGGDFRGAVIDYHAFTGDATWIGTIHIVDDDGEEHITHTEVSSGGTDAENDDLWLVQNEGTISYRRIDGASAALKVHWSAKVFYGSEYYD